MKFNNEFELAHEMIKGELTDTRKWGELQPFKNTTIYKKYFWEMKDKYVRGQSIGKQFFSEEYQECEKECISRLIDFIKYSNLIFPLEVNIDIVDSDGYGVYYKTEFIYDGQMNLSNFGIC